jgi:hypothetical protein
MEVRAMTRKKVLLSLVVALGTVAAIGVWQWTPLRVWWSLRQLREASPDERAACAERLKELGEAAVGPLVDAWRSPDAESCAAAEMGLLVVSSAWSLEDAALTRTAERVHERYLELSTAGKQAALRWSATTLARQGAVAVETTKALTDLSATAENDAESRPTLLTLLAALSRRGQSSGRCRDLALASLNDPTPGVRTAAARVFSAEPLSHDKAALTRIVPLLRDVDGGVRRSALLVVGADADLATEEHLLPLLHDPDAEVRRLCEKTLRSRGLTDDHLRLARLVSDADPSVRLQVLPLLRQVSDLDPEAWLRRLTLDVAPAVRAAAARAAGPVAGMRSRLQEMAQSDPSDTVRDIARFWLERSAVRRTGD